MTATEKRRALGRGLDALLPDAPPLAAPAGNDAVFTCPIERLVPQRGQPRQKFDDARTDLEKFLSVAPTAKEAADAKKVLDQLPKK